MLVTLHGNARHVQSFMESAAFFMSQKQLSYVPCCQDTADANAFVLTVCSMVRMLAVRSLIKWRLQNDC